MGITTSMESAKIHAEGVELESESHANIKVIILMAEFVTPKAWQKIAGGLGGAFSPPAGLGQRPGGGSGGEAPESSAILHISGA